MLRQWEWKSNSRNKRVDSGMRILDSGLALATSSYMYWCTKSVQFLQLAITLQRCKLYYNSVKDLSSHPSCGVTEPHMAHSRISAELL